MNAVYCTVSPTCGVMWMHYTVAQDDEATMFSQQKKYFVHFILPELKLFIVYTYTDLSCSHHHVTMMLSNASDS